MDNDFLTAILETSYVRVSIAALLEILMTKVSRIVFRARIFVVALVSGG
jgi:hypothetical protein